MRAPRPLSTASCCAVKGLSHMYVFMAGATSSGLPQSHARTCAIHAMSKQRQTNDATILDSWSAFPLTHTALCASGADCT